MKKGKEKKRDMSLRVGLQVALALLMFCFSILMAEGPAFAGTVNLPKTGQTKCYDTVGTEIACAGTGQDGEIQAGVAWPSERFTVAGDGDCMTDNMTGLMWVRYPDSVLRDSTTALPYLNSLTVCGYADWRLPNINELESLLNWGEANSAIWLNGNGFDNIMSNYFSSTYNGRNFTYDIKWGVHLSPASVSVNDSGVRGSSYLLSVRATSDKIGATGQIKFSTEGDDGYYKRGVAWPDPRFTDNNDGSVNDNLTGLMWRKAANYGPFTWQGALDQVKGLNASQYLGYSDWRLPNIKELRSLANYSSIPMHLTPFTGTSSYYWSSTTREDRPNYAYQLNGNHGNVTSVDKSKSKYVSYPIYDYYYVWAVRGGQSDGSSDGSSDDLSGKLAYLEFSNITSPQTEDQYFLVTITARDAYGNQIDYNGKVTLSMNMGSAIYPTKFTMSGGIWNSAITIFEAGQGIQITATGDNNRTGKSNTFDVPSLTGWLVGYVKNADSTLLPNATVRIYKTKGGTLAYPSINTSSGGGYYGDGYYSFNDIACGMYYVRAEYNGYISSFYEVPVPCGRYVTQAITIPTCQADGKTPVLLVPGIMGSNWISWDHTIYPHLTHDFETWDSGNLILHDPSSLAGWGNLKDALKSFGYSEGCTMFDVPYDWRLSNDPIKDPDNNSVTKYLKPWIDWAKAKSGSPKVDIIAHSMGGLLTRAYIESEAYENDIDKFAMVGTPNHGGASTYYLWEGGDPKLADDIGEPWFKSAVNFYTNTTENIAQDMYGEEICDHGLSYCSKASILELYRKHVPSIRQLMPTFNTALSTGAITTNDEKNTFLIDLNSAPNIDRMVNDNAGDPTKVKTKIFAGNFLQTITSIYVGPARTSGFYPDGEPNQNMGVRSAEMDEKGDETVLAVQSALLTTGNSAIHEDLSYIWKQGDHSSLVNTFKCDIVSFITDVPASCPSSASARAMQQTGETTPNMVSLNFKGRITPYIVGPSAQGSGINPTTTNLETNIPGSTVNVKIDSGGIAIKDSANGIYTVYLKGIYTEDYRVELNYMDATASKVLKYRGFNNANTTSFTFTVNSSAVDKITVNRIPLPPTGLQADAIDSGGLKTRLTWTANTDAGVTGYNIYAKYIDEPYLAQIGTSAANSFDTGDAWAENASVVTRIYAVSAKKADGTESFLSNMVQNDDRDHDGLTDEQETAFGSNPDGSDSDGDGVNDGEEYARGTNPTLSDSDADGYGDLLEIQMNADPNDVDSVPSIRIAGTPPTYKATLQAAGDAVVANDTVEMVATDIPGDLNYTKGVSSTLKGGFDNQYNSNSSATTILGTLSISSGTLIVDKIVIK